MSNYSYEELQNLSSEFRTVARRLSRTDYSQCDANLKRFIAFIDSNSLISAFIMENNTQQLDIPAILKERGWVNPFDISPVMSEEISLEYQLLKYSVDNYNGDFTRLYGSHNYINRKSTVNDELKIFIEHIIDPLVDYIAEHIRKACERTQKEASDKFEIVS